MTLGWFGLFTGNRKRQVKQFLVGFRTLTRWPNLKHYSLNYFTRLDSTNISPEWKVAQTCILTECCVWYRRIVQAFLMARLCTWNTLQTSGNITVKIQHCFFRENTRISINAEGKYIFLCSVFPIIRPPDTSSISRNMTTQGRTLEIYMICNIWLKKAIFYVIRYENFECRISIGPTRSSKIITHVSDNNAQMEVNIMPVI